MRIALPRHSSSAVTAVPPSAAWAASIYSGSEKHVALRVDDYRQFPPTPGVQHFPIDRWHICTWFPPEDAVLQFCTVRKNIPPSTRWQLCARFPTQRRSLSGETQGVCCIT